MSQEQISLHEYELEVLPLLREKSEHAHVVKNSNLTPVQISRAYQWLENKGLIKLEYKEEEFFMITKKELLFRKIFNHLVENTGYSIEKLRNKFNVDQRVLLSDEGLIPLKKQGIVQLQKTDEGLQIQVKTKPEFKKTDLEAFVENFFEKQTLIATLDAKNQKLLEHARRIPGVVQFQKEKTPVIELQSKAQNIDLSKSEFKSIGQLTSKHIKDGLNEQIEFRPYDVSAKVPTILGGRVHPMTAVIKLVKDIFIEMGFMEMKGPWVETSFWCMDSMWIPQDHPARDVQDTFFLEKQGELPASQLVKKIKSVHENGGETGSTGYGYKWDPEIAKQLVLRTHTTATTYRYLHEKVKKGPAKYFYVGKVFRNEAIDATHLPEFFQVEGFVMDDGLNIQHLLGFITEFYKRLGFEKIKFKTTYNPYTEPSVEALFYDEKRKKWMELINSGIFRPESLAPYSITQPVIAWGLGLERLAMLLLEQNKLKDLIGPSSDLNWLRTYPTLRRSN